MDAPPPNPGAPVLSPAVPQRVLLAILWSGTAFSILTIAARLVIRKRLLHNFKTDDYLVVAALLFSTSSTIIWTVLGGNLYLAMDVATGAEGVTGLLEDMAMAMHGNLASYICLWSSLWSIKLSFMAFFHGLGRHIKSQRILWWAIFIFIAATYVVCIGILDYRCMTSPGPELLANCMNPDVIEYEYANTRVTTTFDIATDVLIVVLSSNIVWRAKIPLRKKLILGGICSLTAAMIVIAIIRITVGSPGKLPDLTWLLLWNSVEMTLAIFVACIASFRGLYCQARNTSRPSEGTPPGPLKKASIKKLFLSTLGTDTILADENEHWAPQENMRDSQENLWPAEVTKTITIDQTYAMSNVTNESHA